ncbi:MAG: hypothetical protein HYU63_03825 [Armatimonadetes bacterium]|nr:hypothetical protein [Armatimonadota bacterium]
MGNNLYFDGKKIAIDRRILPDGMGKEESFWHLISKETRQARQAGRLPDFPRAKRLHWIRPIIENFKDPLIYCWKYLEGNKKIRIYLWLRNFNHLVILEKIKNKTILVTAFTVSLGKEKDLLRRYDKKI